METAAEFTVALDKIEVATTTIGEQAIRIKAEFLEIIALLAAGGMTGEQEAAQLARAQTLGGQLEQFMKCIKITKDELEDQVRAVTKTKGKALKAEVEKLLAGITDPKQNAPSLSRRDEP